MTEPREDQATDQPEEDQEADVRNDPVPEEPQEDDPTTSPEVPTE